MGWLVFEYFIWRDIDTPVRGGFGMTLTHLGLSVWWLNYSRSDIFIIPLASDVVYDFFVGFDWKLLSTKINDIVPLKFGVD